MKLKDLLNHKFIFNERLSSKWKVIKTVKTFGAIMFFKTICLQFRVFNTDSYPYILVLIAYEISFEFSRIIKFTFSFVTLFCLVVWWFYVKMGELHAQKDIIWIFSPFCPYHLEYCQWHSRQSVFIWLNIICLKSIYWVEWVHGSIFYFSVF